jgi:hypothetical protein
MDKTNNTDNSGINNTSNDDSFRTYVIESVTLIAENGDDSRDVLNELRDDHWECGSPETDESEVTDILGDLLDNGPKHLKATAAEIYGYLAPQNFLNHLSQKIITENLYENSVLSEYEAGVGSIEKTADIFSLDQLDSTPLLRLCV